MTGTAGELTNRSMQRLSFMAPQHPRKPMSMIAAPTAIKIFTPVKGFMSESSLLRSWKGKREIRKSLSLVFFVQQKSTGYLLCAGPCSRTLRYFHDLSQQKYLPSRSFHSIKVLFVWIMFPTLYFSKRIYWI